MISLIQKMIIKVLSYLLLIIEVLIKMQKKIIKEEVVLIWKKLNKEVQGNLLKIKRISFKFNINNLLQLMKHLQVAIRLNLLKLGKRKRNKLKLVINKSKKKKKIMGKKILKKKIIKKISKPTKRRNPNLWLKKLKNRRSNQKKH